MELAQSAVNITHRSNDISRLGTWLWRFAVLLLMLLPIGLIGGIATTDIPMTGVALMFVGHVLCEKDWGWLRIKWVPLALLIWAYYIAISFQTLDVARNIDFKYSLVRGALPFGRFIFFAIACQYWLFCHSKVRKWMVIAIACVCAFGAFNAWLQFLFGVDLFGIRIRPAMHPIWPQGYQRLTAISGKMKIGGTIIMQAFPAIVFWLTQIHQRHRSWRYRLMCLAAALMVIAILPLSGERQSTLWMLMGVVCCYLWIPQVRKGLWCILLPCLLCWAVAFSHSPFLANRMLVTIPKVVGNAGMNLVQPKRDINNIYSGLNRTTINLYKAYPVWGVGLKLYQHACTFGPDEIKAPFVKQNNPGNPVCSIHPQNMYLEFLVNTGTVGTVLFLALMAMWAWEIFTARRHFLRCEHSRYGHDKACHMVSVNHPVMIGVLIALLIRVFPFATTTSFYHSWGGVCFWWFGAWVLAYCDACKK